MGKRRNLAVEVTKKGSSSSLALPPAGMLVVGVAALATLVAYGGAGGDGGGDGGTGGGGGAAAETAYPAVAKQAQAGTGAWTDGYFAEEAGRGDGAAATAAAPWHAQVYPNGGDGMPTAIAFSSAEQFTALGRVYNEVGQIVPSLAHFVNGSRLYRAPTQAGRHFQWPAVRVGLKRTVPGLFSEGGKQVEIETLTDPRPEKGGGGDPRVFYVHNFMSKAETQHLISFATDERNPYKMAPSTAATHKSWSEGGRGAVSTTRTSMNAFDMMTPVSFRIKERAFRLLRMGGYDEAMADGIQILRYELGQAYISHHDYFPTRQSADHNWDPEKGGSNRFATIFLYLSDVEFGGQTVFPQTARLTNDTSAALVERLGQAPSKEKLEALLNDARLRKNSWEADLIQKCYTRFAVPPRAGDAILFYSQKPDGKLDPSSIHGACPVLTGTKWGANLWVWNACRFGQCKVDPLNPAGELAKGLKAPFK